MLSGPMAVSGKTFASNRRAAIRDVAARRWRSEREADHSRRLGGAAPTSCGAKRRCDGWGFGQGLIDDAVALGELLKRGELFFVGVRVEFE